MLQQYVYLIKSKGDNYYKIGHTKDVKERLQQLELNSPFELEIVFAKQVDDAVKIEGNLHLMYSAKNVKGEWFRLSQEDKEAIESYVNNIDVRNILAQQTPLKHKCVSKRDLIQHNVKFDFDEPVIVTNRNMPEYIITNFSESSINSALSVMNDLKASYSSALSGNPLPGALRINPASDAVKSYSSPTTPIKSPYDDYNPKSVKSPFDDYNVKPETEGGVELNEKHSHK